MCHFKEKKRLTVFETGEPRNIVGLQRKGETGGWEKTAYW
jgi:hypothetical protein